MKRNEKIDDIVIVAAKRTPIGSLCGQLSNIPAVELGAIVIKDLLTQTRIPKNEIDQVIMGQVLSAGCGQNPARQAALKAGLPESVTGLTINKVCGSGLVAVNLAVQAIRNGDAQVVIAGGQENMSKAGHVISDMRKGIRLGNSLIVDTLVLDGLTDAFNNYHMGITAENVAAENNISRDDQDRYALQSQNKARTASQANAFKYEITPVITNNPHKGEIIIDHDEGPRETSLEQLLSLKPVFKKEGVVTAGNSSTINDGAAAVIVCTRQKALSLGLTPLVTIGSFANTGISPTVMGLGPISAIRQCLNKANKSIDEIDLFECNEAFAAQALAVKRALNLPDDKLNINGGAIALGHPIGASGCRILVSLIHQLTLNNLKSGVASLCVGGGEGVAMYVYRH
ncbi:acetyl-CoA C-acetyltransferase [Orbus sturtevantii]|uniref:acetyl-CoA C-acetyltransferase n=1 Tax=Orbus sturtevantii TaxID=3074109 RepID=UPI00370DB017